MLPKDKSLKGLKQKEKNKWEHDFEDLKDTIDLHASKEELMLCESITHSTSPVL